MSESEYLLTNADPATVDRFGGLERTFDDLSIGHLARAVPRVAPPHDAALRAMTLPTAPPDRAEVAKLLQVYARNEEDAAGHREQQPERGVVALAQTAGPMASR